MITCITGGCIEHTNTNWYLIRIMFNSERCHLCSTWMSPPPTSTIVAVVLWKIDSDKIYDKHEMTSINIVTTAHWHHLKQEHWVRECLVVGISPGNDTLWSAGSVSTATHLGFWWKCFFWHWNSVWRMRNTNAHDARICKSQICFAISQSSSRSAHTWSRNHGK